MLRSVIFLLVTICLITTPTRAYEAYNNLDLHVLQTKTIEQEQELKNLSANREQTKEEKRIVGKNIHNDICSLAVARAEKQYNIKPELLQTIASVESGKWDERYGRRIAWPWTIQVGGKGYYYKSKAEAVSAVKDLYAKGITNIDVGCMQINMKYHGSAFKSAEDALDPVKNAAYSAKFLYNLYQKNGHNWQKTAMQYHSKNYSKGMVYKSRLEKHYAEHINPNANQTLF